jgi:ABC-2 type transport system ATP-binding protein
VHASGPAPIEMENVTRRFGGVVAVNDASLWVGAGTILGLIGPSGSGKTTMVRMLTGTLAPSSGRVAVLGETPARFRRETRERLGYMPQQFHLYPHLTTSENIAFCATLFGLFWWHRRRRVREVLELTQLYDARDRLAKDLSGGQQRRLQLACALVHEPEVLFVDEPTAGLDPLLRQTVWDEFARLRAAGRTLFVTTQTVSDAQYCDGVAMLVKGTLVAVGEPAALRREAFGGDILDIRTDGPARRGAIEGIEGVRTVEQPAKDRLLVTADDAGVVVPRITDALNASGSRVLTADKHEPTFDEVFVELVERSGAGEREEVAS